MCHFILQVLILQGVPFKHYLTNGSLVQQNKHNFAKWDQIFSAAG